MDDKIFISYSRADFEKVIAIKREIDSLLSINCWIDLDGIESGNDHFEKVIIEAINRHPIMLFMLSENSMNSEYAMKELRYAKAKNKNIILIDLGCNNGMTDEFLFNFKGADIIDYENELQNRKLMKDLALLCNRSIDVTNLTWKFKNGDNRLARVLYLSLYIIVACVCCVLCVDSLWGVVDMNKNLLWIVVISYFILCSVGFSQISYSVGVRRTTKEIIFKFFGGIGLIVIFGIAFLIPCQTHTLYYRFHVEKNVYDDISDLKKHLYTIDNSASSVLLENINGENDVMVICDIPTSIGASYETAKDILAVYAADLKDVNAEIRFLRKEANMFYLTLKRLLAMNILSENVSIHIDIVSLIDM